MLNDGRTHGLWERTAPPAPATQALNDDRRVDVAVVGAGFTGLSAALRLSQAGVGTAVLEAVEIGFGGSGRNVGLVNAGLWTLPDEPAKILGAETGERLVSMLSDAPRMVFDLIETHKIACEPVRAGTLHCGVGRSGLRQLEERARQWQARGADVTLLGADETRHRIGSGSYAGALLDRRAGTIQPLAYVRGLAGAAMEAGASIFTQSPVTGYHRCAEGWRIETPNGTLTADWIIVATNAYTRTPWPEIRREIVHLPYFNIATAPLSASLAGSILPERHGLWDTKNILTSLRADRAGRLIIGSVGALRGAGAAIHRRWARRSLARLFPQLADVAFEAEWFGQIGMTVDAMPRLHRLDDRVLSVSGYNGRGIAPGTVFGHMLARFILGELAKEALPLPFTEPAARRLRGPREAFYEVGSQLAHLRA